MGAMVGSWMISGCFNDVVPRFFGVFSVVFPVLFPVLLSVLLFPETSLSALFSTSKLLRFLGGSLGEVVVLCVSVDSASSLDFPSLLNNSQKLEPLR